MTYTLEGSTLRVLSTQFDYVWCLELGTGTKILVPRGIIWEHGVLPPRTVWDILSSEKDYLEPSEENLSEYLNDA